MVTELVCQVSSTLYNAALAAKMTIIERHGHSMTVPYVEKGRDAAVVHDEKDFRFFLQKYTEPFSGSNVLFDDQNVHQPP